MNPQTQVLNHSKKNLYILLIFFSFIGFATSNLIAQTNKKKPPIEKEKKVIETAKETSPTKKEDESRDADDDDKSEATESAAEDNFYFKVIAKSGAVLRDKPKVSGKKINIIPEDTIGEVLEETKEKEVIDARMGNWLKVEYKGKIGWIFSGLTIIKEDKEDFLPLTLIGYFLIKSPEPIFYRKPGREILGIIPDYPEKGEIVPVYRKKKYYENDYYYFELKSPKLDSEKIVSSWIGEKSGNFLSEEAFSAYTLRSRKKKLKTFEMEMVEEILRLYSENKQAINYAKIEIQPISFKEKSKKKKAYIINYPTGAKTKKGLGNFEATHYLIWKEGETYHSLLAGDKKNLKIQDIDKDGIPEILAQFETAGEPPLCHIYAYQNGMFSQLFPNYLFCDTLQVLSDGNIVIQKEKEKIIYKYSKGTLEKLNPDTKPIPVPKE